LVGGHIIVLDGTSSAGKTTLAKGLQARFEAIGECWLITGVDDYFGKLPRSWLAVGRHVGAHADDGCVFDTSGEGFEMRMGPVGRTLLHAYRESVGAMARAGMNVIVDDVMLHEEEWESWQRAIDGLDVTWVRVRIDLDVLEAREIARKDRVLGMARWQYDLVHRFADYDVEVDTGVLDEEAAADFVFAETR
jgi:chloramphenicol 3-O phosphotransferase